MRSIFHIIVKNKYLDNCSLGYAILALIGDSDLYYQEIRTTNWIFGYEIYDKSKIREFIEKIRIFNSQNNIQLGYEVINE